LAERIKTTRIEGKKFEESQILNWSIQATTALKYLHFEKKIAHRDIKPGYIKIEF
jgi:serine/threonine protein kinase